MRLSLRFTCLFLFLARFSFAALITVNPAGGGNYTSLQTALDAAASGDTIHVVGGSYPSIKINKPVTIVGGPRPLIYSIPNPINYQFHLPAITLFGSGTGKVVLANIKTGGTTDGIIQMFSNPVIMGSGFQELNIFDSDILPAPWKFLSGTAQGRPALNVSIPLVLIERSRLVAQDSDTDSCYGPIQIPGGPPAISAGNSTVIILDSVVEGGDGSQVCGYEFPPSSVVCPCPWLGGKGGDALHVGTAFVANTTITPGKGWDVYYYDPNHLIQPWGKQADGVPIVGGTLTTLSDDLKASGPFTVGSTGELSWTTSGLNNTLYGATATKSPVHTFADWFFLDGPLFLSQPLLPASQNLPYSVPSDLPLGAAVWLQIYDGAAQQLTRPVGLIVLP